MYSIAVHPEYRKQFAPNTEKLKKPYSSNLTPFKQP